MNLFLVPADVFMLILKVNLQAWTIASFGRTCGVAVCRVVGQAALSLVQKSVINHSQLLAALCQISCRCIVF